MKHMTLDDLETKKLNYDVVKHHIGLPLPPSKAPLSTADTHREVVCCSKAGWHSCGTAGNLAHFLEMPLQFDGGVPPMS